MDQITSTNINRVMLMDYLSEFLAVEQGGLKLYRAALQIVQHDEIRRKFHEFHQETLKHVTILEKVIRGLGGDPSYQSTSAKIAEKKADGLLQTMTATNGMSAKLAEINAIENIVLAETKDQADWALLGKIARQTTDSRLGDVLKAAVDEVEPEENEHLTWTKSKMAELAMGAVSE
jgi:rubrerythrin